MQDELYLTQRRPYIYIEKIEHVDDKENMTEKIFCRDNNFFFLLLFEWLMNQWHVLKS